jgi:hypothetical protein
MNAHKSFFSIVVLNQLQKIITTNTKQTKYLMSVPQKSNTGGKINGNIDIHCLASTITDLAVRKPSWCAPSRSIPLQGF